MVDLRDLVWEYIPYNSFFKKITRHALKLFALLSIKKADIIAASNPIELTYLKSKLPSRKILLVSNGIGNKAI